MTTEPDGGCIAGQPEGMLMRRQVVGVCLLLAIASVACGAEPTRPASERFAKLEAAEAPDFQRHVSPLLGRVGCNGRSCHGSFQGQGGFRLSLFGYDFAADHASILKRVDRGTPNGSLFLRKPTRTEPHQGGRVIEPGSWQHHLLQEWVNRGAKGTSTPARLMRLEITPQEIVLAKKGDSVTLRVVAHWADETSEDVTCLCRFQSNQPGIAEVDPSGQVTASGHGDTHVVVFYDNGVTPVPVLVAVHDATNYPNVPAPTRVDEFINAKLRKLGIVPSALCGEAEFLRRISIDLTGTLPTPAEVDAFLTDTTLDKRAKKIDELLDSAAYAAWWANKFGDYTGNSGFGQGDRIGTSQAERWYEWLRIRIAANTPYDQIVEGIMLAGGRRDGQSYADYSREMTSYYREKVPDDFAKRPTLPNYWTRERVKTPEDKALAFAHSFLGLRLQCSQCHKHPFDRWTQKDFQQLAAVFAPVQYGVPPESQSDYTRVAKEFGQAANGNRGVPVTQEMLAVADDKKLVPWREVYIDEAKALAGKSRLLGDEVDFVRGKDPRVVVMKWMRQPNNPYFARAIVNRIWANYFPCGLVDPADDLNLANPPSHPELLDFLARDFVANGYDLKRLHRRIVSSDAYQRDWKPNTTNRDDRRNFSRAVPRRLPAEVAYDALTQITAATRDLAIVRSNLDRRAVGHLSTRLAGTYAMNVFGKPTRQTVCDCERSNTPSLLQAIFLQNDPILQTKLAESGWIKEIAETPKPHVPALVREAYLRTVSREPTGDELHRAEKHTAESESVAEAIRDLLWALVNTKEFLLNH